MRPIDAHKLKKRLDRYPPEIRVAAKKAVDCCKTVKIEPERWIPVTERLPEKQGFYCVTVGAPYKSVRIYEYKPCEGYEHENLWKGTDGSYCFNWFVEAWCELPEPYKGGAEDEQ